MTSPLKGHNRPQKRSEKQTVSATNQVDKYQELCLNLAARVMDLDERLTELVSIKIMHQEEMLEMQSRIEGVEALYRELHKEVSRDRVVELHRELSQKKAKGRKKREANSVQRRPHKSKQPKK